MSDHDALASQAMKLKKMLEFYVIEHGQLGETGLVAIALATKLLMVIDMFPEVDE